MKKKKSVKTGIIVAILLLAVGFAAVTTQLIINGIATIRPDNANFRKYVVFSNDDEHKPFLTTTGQSDTTLEGDDIGAVEVIDDGKTISFTTPIFNQIGEEVTLHYHITNRSQYNARLATVACVILNEDGTELSDSENKYLEVIADNKLNGSVLRNNAITDEDTVRIRMIRSYVGTPSYGGADQVTKAEDEVSTDILDKEVKKYKVHCEMSAAGEEINEDEYVRPSNN
ncbi:MAG: hypothetical protein K2G03_03080 [Bacilli bacterium]|nr:hypothetical protein [Bacilli bacterium]MDE6141565.1 hypothetical protein [Bacilli bacterium]